MSRLRIATLLLLAACWDFDGAVARCKENPALCTPGGGPLVGEAASGAAACSDGQDNDGDGKTDCADSDCDQVVCRGASAECDAEERCSNAACPDDALQPLNHECRAKGGDCDVAEVCDGVSPACPSNALVDAGVVCSMPSSLCLLPAKCTGTMPACPQNNLAPPGKPCRDAVAECDVDERCTGSDPECPPDRFADAGVVCRPVAGGANTCDVEELCTGFEATCPDNGFRSATFVCRPATGACDRPERCDGGSAACPADLSFCPGDQFCNGTGCVPKLGVGVTCTDDSQCTSGTCADGVCCSTGCAGACDVCNLPGSLGTCLPAPATVTCRPSAGPCDIAEKCNGTLTTCPSDVLLDTTVVCRGDAGVCDVAEVCSGTSVSCPTDNVLAPTVTCRPVAGVCDLPESCNGVDPTCPADSYAAGMRCRDAGSACDQEESCNGAQAACPNDRLLDAGSACGPVVCINGNITPAPSCTSGGACTPATARSCNGFQCASATQCRTTCSGPGDCITGFICNGSGACVAAADAGTPCSVPSQCATGFCSNGICCNESCDGTCQECGTDGICVKHAAGTDPEGGCGAYACDGMGLCKTNCNGQPVCSGACKSSFFCSTNACVPTKGNGATCSNNCECTSGACNDGICCNRACGGSCEFCAAGGTCTSRGAGTDPEGGCGQFTCNGTGACYTNCVGGALCTATQCKSTAYCNGTMCIGDLANGGSCSNPCMCTSNTCTTFFTDTDNDGYGVGGGGNLCGSSLAGLATNNLDCCDSDSRAHPGGGAYTSPRTGCGGYDFDCNGADTRSDTSTNGCSLAGSCSGGDTVCTGDGWAGAGFPACGASATYNTCSTQLNCNQATCPGCERCSSVSGSTQTQSCR
ncbi:MAG: hypothetical protein IPJ65_33845 [Archangiaceae bacterium]|nr:hypothetical protein [Archangiaceae bacterium]